MAVNSVQSSRVLDLPTELLTMVAEAGSKEDLLALRSTCRAIRTGLDKYFARTCFSSRTHVVTYDGLQALAQICRVPLLAKSIRAITLVVLDLAEGWRADTTDAATRSHYLELLPDMPTEMRERWQLRMEQEVEAQRFWKTECDRLNAQDARATLLAEIFTHLAHVDDGVSLVITNQVSFSSKYGGTPYGMLSLYQTLAGKMEEVKDALNNAQAQLDHADDGEEAKHDCDGEQGGEDEEEGQDELEAECYDDEESEVEHEDQNGSGSDTLGDSDVESEKVAYFADANCNDMAFELLQTAAVTGLRLDGLDLCSDNSAPGLLPCFLERVHRADLHVQPCWTNLRTLQLGFDRDFEVSNEDCTATVLSTLTCLRELDISVAYDDHCVDEDEDDRDYNNGTLLRAITTCQFSCKGLPKLSLSSIAGSATHYGELFSKVGNSIQDLRLSMVYVGLEEDWLHLLRQLAKHDTLQHLYIFDIGKSDLDVFPQTLLTDIHAREVFELYDNASIKEWLEWMEEHGGYKE